MKRHLLTAMAVMLSVCGYSQTKGTIALSLGLGLGSHKVESSSYISDYSTTNVSLGYGYFFKDNNKIELSVSYGGLRSDNANRTENDNIRGFLGYQHLYPLFDKLYAFAGGFAGYGVYNQTEFTDSQESHKHKTHELSAGANGGVSWFFSKRFALETTLLQASMNHTNSKQVNSIEGGKNTNTNFNLSTQGSLTNLNFKIYLLF